MPRKKISEYRAKTIIAKALSVPYQGWSIDTSGDLTDQLSDIPASKTYVVKVDQGIKGRFKKGLVLLDVAHADLAKAAGQLKRKGYRSTIVEPMFAHKSTDERYLCLTYDRESLYIHHSTKGGVDIEQHADTIAVTPVSPTTNWGELARQTGLSADQLQRLIDVFDSQYMTYLEINPYVVEGNQLHLLDLAIEVDDAGAYFSDGWSEGDFRDTKGREISQQEREVIALNQKSPAAFTLDVINPNGSCFLLLSGGGASVVVADEVYRNGLGEQLANYGEYSGNPNADEVYVYTKAVLELMLASAAPKKVLVIGGAVANFTDIATTFSGIIRAIDELSPKLKKQHVRVYVRRGGPRQEIGLARIRKALDAHQLLGAVHGPDVPIYQLIKQAVQELA